jgi:hypothetical protein
MSVSQITGEILLTAASTQGAYSILVIGTLPSTGQIQTQLFYIVSGNWPAFTSNIANSFSIVNYNSIEITIPLAIDPDGDTVTYSITQTSSSS